MGLEFTKVAGFQIDYKLTDQVFLRGLMKAKRECQTAERSYVPNSGSSRNDKLVAGEPACVKA